MLLKENVDMKSKALIWFCCMIRKNSTEGAHSSEPQKAHPTSEFILGSQNDGHARLYLASSLVIVVREAGSEADYKF